MEVEPITPDDYAEAVKLVGAWSEREVHERLHPIFFHHFGGYSVRDEHGLVAFLLGMRSQRHEDVAHIHLVAVSPEHRGEKIATRLYERFEQQARAWESVWVEAITDADNERSRAFHRSLGFIEVGELEWVTGRPALLLRKRVDYAT